MITDDERDRAQMEALSSQLALAGLAIHMGAFLGNNCYDEVLKQVERARQHLQVILSNAEYLQTEGKGLRRLNEDLIRSGDIPTFVEACDHKFINSKQCLKCGWEP